MGDELPRRLSPTNRPAAKTPASTIIASAAASAFRRGEKLDGRAAAVSADEGIVVRGAAVGIVGEDGAGTGIVVRADCDSRFSRFKLAASSEAVWERKERFFSIAVLVIFSSFGGRLGFSLTGDDGVRFRMASNTTPEVFPENA